MSRLDEGDPVAAWEDFVARHRVGDIVDGRVTKVVPFGAFVEVAGGVAGLVVGESRPAAGSRVSVRIKEIDAERHRLGLLLAG